VVVDSAVLGTAEAGSGVVGWEAGEMVAAGWGAASWKETVSVEAE